MSDRQLDLALRPRRASASDAAIWSPRDIWINLTPELISVFEKEDRRIEYKIATVSLDVFAQYFSMCSNTTEGGVIVAGVDKNSNPVGCSYVGTTKLNEIEKLHFDRCPLAKPEFRRIPIQVNGKADFLLAIYLPYVGKLVETNKGKAYTRYGDSIHEMTDEEKNDFRSSRHELSWEQQDCGLSFPTDFDPNIIEEFCTRFRVREDLDSARSNDELLELSLFGRREKGKFVPNNALALLGGREPRRLIPGCRVRIQRFEGTAEGTGDTYNPLIDRFADGNVVQILEKARAIIESALYDFTWLDSHEKFITTKEYPQAAWFEALVNACVHRSFSFSGTDVTVKIFRDRFEVESPGGFCPPVNEKNVYDVRAARNPLLMNGLYRLGYTRMTREGTRRMRMSMQEWDLPEPKFKQETLHGVMVRVTLFNNEELRKRVLDKDVVEFFGLSTWKSLADDEQKIATYAFRNEIVNVTDAQQVIGRTWKTCKNILTRLTNKKILQFVQGSYMRDNKAHYRLRKRA